MPTKINAFSAVNGEPIQLLDGWFGTQLANAADAVDHHHHGLNSHSRHPAVVLPTTAADMGPSAALRHSMTSISAMSDSSQSSPTASLNCRRGPFCSSVEGLTFEHGDEALAWTLTKRKLLAIIGKADCFVSARTCPYDILVGVSVIDNPAANKDAPATERAAAAALSGSEASQDPISVGRNNFAGQAIANSIIGCQPPIPFGVPNTAAATAAAGVNCLSIPHSPTTAVAAQRGEPFDHFGGGPVTSTLSRMGSTHQSGASTPFASLPNVGGGAMHHHASSPSSLIGGSTAALVHHHSRSAVVVADPPVEPEYRPWPASKGSLGEILSQFAEEQGVALSAADDAPKASDAVGFAAAMVAKMCRKAVLHNPNRSEAHFVVNLLVLSRPIGNEYAPSHGLYRVPHAPSAVTKERCSSAVVMSVIGKIMEETRVMAEREMPALIPTQQPTATAPNTATNSYADRPPLPRAAIGVAEKVKQHGPQFLQELRILELALAAEAERAEVAAKAGLQEVERQQGKEHLERERQEAAVLEKLLAEHYQNSIDVVVQFTGAEERDALFALLDSNGSLEGAAARLTEAPNGSYIGTAVVPLARLRGLAKSYLDEPAVHKALEAHLGNCLGALNGAGMTASGAPLSAASLPLVACADRLITMGYTQEEASRASRGAGGSFDLAAGYLAGDHGVHRMVRMRYEEVLWFNAIVEAVQKKTARAPLKDIVDVVTMIANDPQAVLAAWHTPHQQPVVRMLNDAFVQAIMQHKQTAMLRMQQQQQQQMQARGGGGGGNSAACPQNANPNTPTPPMMATPAAGAHQSPAAPLPHHQQQHQPFNAPQPQQHHQQQQFTSNSLPPPPQYQPQQQQQQFHGGAVLPAGNNGRSPQRGGDTRPPVYANNGAPQQHHANNGHHNHLGHSHNHHGHHHGAPPPRYCDAMAPNNTAGGQ